MSLEIYKIIHLFGLMTLFFGLGGMLVAGFAGYSLSGKAKAMAYATHGLGLLLILFGGFGMAARLGLMAAMPGWIHAKIAIWVIMGGIISVIKRKAQWGWVLLIILLGLGLTAATIGITKPF